VGPCFDSELQALQNNKENQTIFPASVAVLEEAMRQFREVFSFPNIPHPIMTSYRLWNGEAGFGFAVHQWAINADDREVKPCRRRLHMQRGVLGHAGLGAGLAAVRRCHAQELRNRPPPSFGLERGGLGACAAEREELGVIGIR